MTRYPLARFVEAIGSTTVRLDLNDGTLRIGEETKSDAFGQPEWDAEPAQEGGEDGYRTTSLQVICGKSKPQAARAFRRLALELQRPQSILMWQDSKNAEPRWIRCYRSQLPAMSYEFVGAGDEPDGGGDAWQVALSLDSDAYAYGKPVTLTRSILNRPDRLPRATSALNYCPNPSFETSGAGWAGGTVTTSTTPVAGTQAYGVLTPVTSWEWVTDTLGDLDLPDELEGPWVLSGHVTPGLEDQCQIQATVTWLDTTGQELSQDHTDPIPLTGGATTRFHVVSTPPEGAWHGRLSIHGETTTETPVTPTLDAVMYEPGDTPSEYADGDSAGWGWTAQRGLSPSGPLDPTTGRPAHAVFPATLIEGDGPAETIVRVMPEHPWHVTEPLLQLTAFEAPGSDVAPIVLSINPETSSSGFIYADSGTSWAEVDATWTWVGMDDELSWSDL